MRTGWHYVTDTSSLRDPGSQVLWDIGGVPIVVVRALDGEIRGFVNICRHRAHPVVLEDQCRNTLQCHYHGWTYDLDGSLRNAPRSGEEPEFDTAPLGLVADPGARVGPDGVGQRRRSTRRPSTTTPTGWRRSSRRGAAAWRTTSWPSPTSGPCDCNWKVLLDNTIECYHCPTTHPELSRALVMDPDKQQLEIGGRNWIYHLIPFRDGVPDRAPRGSATRTASSPTSSTTSSRPPTCSTPARGSTSARCRRSRWTRSAGVTSRSCRRTRRRRSRAAGQVALAQDPTINQDVVICNRVQASHESGFAPPGHLLPRSEALLTHFYRRIVELVTDGQ